MSEHAKEAVELIGQLAPRHAKVPIRIPLEEDEARWFLKGVEQKVIVFRQCPSNCFRAKKWGAVGPDHFDTPSGNPRHLFSKPLDEVAWLNREYIPHIAAYAAAILRDGYDANNSSFSLYRKFSNHLILKTKGQDYETDVEFYYSDGSGIHLQIEAKASPKQTMALATAIKRHGELRELPVLAAKEIEYVLDLAPSYLWIVGPGSIDPPGNVFAVSVTGKNALFSRVDGVPPPPPPSVRVT